MELIEVFMGLFEVFFEWRQDPDRLEAKEEKKRDARFSYQVGGRQDDPEEAPQAISMGTSSRHDRD